MKRALLLIVCSLGWIAPAGAQTCQGLLTFAQAPTRVRADALFTTDNRIFGVGLSKGTENLFGSGGLLIHQFSGDSGTDLGFFGNVGKELTMSSSKKYSVCPTGTIAYVGFDGGSNVLVNVGASVGYPLATSGTTQIIPTGAVSLSHDRIGSDFGGSFSETFLNLQVGVGLIFNGKMSLQPQVVLPIGSDLADPTFAVDFLYKIGK